MFRDVILLGNLFLDLIVLRIMFLDLILRYLIPALDSRNVFLYLILGILFLGLGNRWNDRRRVLVAWKERLYLGQMLDGVVRSSVSFFLRASDVDILLHFSEALKCGYFVAFVSEALKS